MSTIVLRSVKGSALTFQEGDDNFTNLNTDKLENITNESVGDLSDIDIIGIADGQVLIWDNLNSKFVPGSAGGLSNVVEDTTPELGGDLNCLDARVISPVLEDYAETVYSLGSTDTPSLTVSNGNVQSVTITSGLTLPEFTDHATGQSMTLLVSGSGTITGSVNHKFAGGNTTLTTDSVISIFYDGTTYWTSVATDFQ